SRAGLVADTEALGGVLVSPDMDPLVERAKLGMARSRQRRQLDPPLDPLGPARDDLLGDAGLHRVGADLVQVTVLPWRERRAERRRIDDLALHLDDEFLDLRRPVRDRLRAHPGPVLEIVIGPNVDDMV